MLSELLSGFIQAVHGPHPFAMVTLFIHSKFQQNMNYVANRIDFVIACFVSKRGMELELYS